MNRKRKKKKKKRKSWVIQDTSCMDIPEIPMSYPNMRPPHAARIQQAITYVVILDSTSSLLAIDVICLLQNVGEKE